MAGQRYVWNGRTWVPAESQAVARVGGYSCSSRCWPQNMGDSLGCHHKEVAKAQARAKRHGINVTYLNNGDVIVPDRNERRKLLKMHGLVDKNSFYGY